MAERLPPHWLDDVIAGAHHLLGSDEHAIAKAICNSPQLSQAISRGIAEAKRADPNAKGASHAQCIRVAVVERINSAN